MTFDHSITTENKKNIRLEIYAISLAAISGILYGFLGYFGTKLLKTNMSVPTMLFWRFFVAAIWIMLCTLWTERRLLPRVALSYCIQPYLLGGLCYGGAAAFFFTASQSTGTGLAMVIFFSFPVFVALYGLRKNQWRMGRYTLISLVAIVLGLVLLRGSDAHQVSLMGILFAVLSALFYSFYVYKSKNMMRHTVSNHFATMICLGCALFFLTISIASHRFTIPHTLTSWGYVLALAVIATAVPVQLLLACLKTISPLKASMLSVLEPVITLFIGVALLDETVTELQVYGVIIVIAGAILIQFSRD
jgi:drug/metabolite transporter (DMT)-like permease